jgi:tellurite resistance protein TehA-like permease
MQSSVDAVNPGPSSSGIRQTVQAFPPVCFAMVMATGIVSIAVYLNGMQRLAATLMWLNVMLFIAFWILLIGRLALAPRSLLEELTSFKLVPGFFTIVARSKGACRRTLRRDLCAGNG